MIWTSGGAAHRPLEATLGKRRPGDALASSNTSKCVSADAYGRSLVKTPRDECGWNSSQYQVAPRSPQPDVWNLPQPWDGRADGLVRYMSAGVGGGGLRASSSPPPRPHRAEVGLAAMPFQTTSPAVMQRSSSAYGGSSHHWAQR
eukprot:CAMPEP_0177447640 /NCGR_PEP_ID=MMETSP0369-20130122/7739_1 /TAXON_ID=447022 ORGANISM="Scrippsiella hangoei-like, Strain SHHI-4" /NCGR_SAMPLE_ID=MMETSP0369 /ASSEMBLY_ACC=CAM_ASM_000364 /LENGTH=144 /DNA_ID=CAMNT_0018919973 /DNA_START=126 /DNA_END=560 /DNA_ORIENTATION=+